MHQYAFVKTFSKGLKCKKGRIFMNILKFTVLHDNAFYRFILCIMCLSAQQTVLYDICLFCEFYIPMKPL